MKNFKTFIATAMALTAAAMIPAANAATAVMVLGSGSSAIWQTAGIGAYKLAGNGAGHYTVKGDTGCTQTPACAQLVDSRDGSSILPEGGNLWVVWNAAQTEVWADVSVDSVVGNRMFLAAPRAKLAIDAKTQTTVVGQNLIASALWGADASVIPAAVYTALNNAQVTAAFTDIRPEDAKFAETRAVSTLDPTDYTGLGYGTGPNTLIGTPVHSAFSTSQANPVDFSLGGSTDPFTSDPTPKNITIPIGATPIVFIINRTNANGLGSPNFGGSGKPLENITDAQAQKVFSGTECDTTALGGTIADEPIYPILREPISGTMNTTEFTVFRIKADPDQSQEANVGEPTYPSSSNPLAKTCVGGKGERYRAIGTGEMVNGSGTTGGILNTKDGIGYTFFGYGNVSKIAGSASYGYVQLDSVDPIATAYTNGDLPTCTAPCPVTPGASFPNLRKGKYRAWSVLRVVTDVSGANYTNTSALVTSIQENINSTVPDFVPFKAVGSDPGLKYYRSHYLQSGVAPNNGLSGQTEAGGDMGGCIEPVGPAPGILSCHQ
jgi:ABC-type phosphate transport system substrate-binding protein